MMRGIYRHPACLDIEFDVVKVQYVGQNYIKFKVLYRYMRSKEYVSLTPESVILPMNKYKQWQRMYGEY